MVILSGNPYEMPKEELCNLKVEKLLLGGEEYKPQSNGVVKARRKGMFSDRKA